MNERHDTEEKSPMVNTESSPVVPIEFTTSKNSDEQVKKEVNRNIKLPLSLDSNSSFSLAPAPQTTRMSLDPLKIVLEESSAAGE